MAALGSILLAFRYVFFALFVVCNAVICSVAVWNNSLAGTSGRSSQIDAYLIFVAASAILFIIPIVAIDIFRNNAVVNRVWFECLWVGLFWVMELAGASAVTASLTEMVCAPANPSSKETCTSSTVLVAFTWLCTILLLTYLLSLALSAVLHQDETDVWHSGVRTFPWFASIASLASTPPSPVRQIQQKPLHLAAPRPQRPVRQATLERDLEYGLERTRAAPTYEPARRAPVPAPSAPAPSQAAPSLYPAYLNTQLPSHPGISQPTGATPPPLGDWPRSSRKPTRDAPPSAFTGGAASQQPETSAPLTRPTHPRKGSNGSPSRQRPVPPPLDLTKISAYRTIDGRVSRR